jgi:hypothetical protein
VLQGDEEERGKAMTRLLVPQRVVHGYRDGSITQIRLPIREVPNFYHYYHHGGPKDGQPKHIMDWALSGVYEGDGSWGDLPGHFFLDVQTDVDDNSHKEIFPPVLPGQEFWLPETWRRIKGEIDAYEFGKVVNVEDYFGYEYKDGSQYWHDDFAPIDDEFHTSHVWSIDKWRSPVTMPLEAARTFGKARTVRIGRVQEIMPHEAKAEGYGGHSNSGIAILADCMATWDAEHPRDLWAGNPWTWIIEPERSKA